MSECRNAHANPSLRASSQNWPLSGPGWVANKEHLPGPQLSPASDSVCARCSGPEKDAEDTEQPQELQIKVSGQRGSLGISIAGGKGSLPYKEHDEGIFISRVSKGGPSEKAGIHVGDRLLEVNGLNMQGATHHEAVSALRNAGSCIKMKVLRDRMLPREVCVQDSQAVPSRQQSGRDAGQRRTDSSDCLSKRIEAVVCNGNGILESDPNWTLFEREPEALVKNNTLQVVKNTMTIPRIILTHPSTSDEDVEPLTHAADRHTLDDFDIPDGRIHSDCFNSAFYPP
ncbi:uncharacterized protein LOC144542349 [Centroberyx gerrardi]